MPETARIGGFLVLICLWLGTAPLAAHTDHHAEAPAAVAAPLYRQPDYAVPVPGTYTLSVLGNAADGDVLTTDGDTRRLHDVFADRYVLLSFIYTTCPDPAGCPLATGVLYQTQRLLAKDPRLAGKLRLISLSFDPDRDTPAVMKRYGEGLAGPDSDWFFLTTASQEKLRPLLAAYNQAILQDADEQGNPLGTYSHLLRVFLIDRQQRIRNIYSTSFLYPELLRNDVLTLLLETAQPAKAATQADAPLSSLYQPGDDQPGDENTDYATRSVSLPRRLGKPGNLIRNTQAPPLGLPPVPVPANNPIITAKIQLGRKLFFDRRLSFNNTLSCAMCHIPEQGFTHNELATAVGNEGRTVRRNAPTLYNVAYLRRLFHDGREMTLENQIWQPLLAQNEMANPSIGMLLETIDHLPDYRGLFEIAFAGKGATVETVGMAIASYERTLVSGNSPFDRWYYGNQQDALGKAAKQGFRLFTGKARCVVCHTIGPDEALLTDNQFHNTGIGYQAATYTPPQTRRVQVAPGIFLDVPQAVIASVSEPPPSDLGLYEITQNPEDRWKYRTPSLRNVALTAPYMHNGSLTTLDAVIEFYNAGGIPNELLDPALQRLHLSKQEKRDLTAFLNALTGDNVEALVADAFAAPVGDVASSESEP